MPPAEDHCALNVCLYGGGKGRWAMTERGQRQVQREPRRLAIGPSRLDWNGQSLDFDIDERCAPLPRRVRGSIRVHPLGLSRFSAALDAAGRHRWGPIAPCARVEVDLPEPGLRWRGNAYLDSNEGDEPIERGFRRWSWLRAPLADGRCAVVYDVQPREGEDRLVSASFAADGSVGELNVPSRVRLAATSLWRVAREVRCDAGPAPPKIEQTLEDTPFYARSLVQMPLSGERVLAVHETLDVRRLSSVAVQGMLPFRMPRRR